MGQFAKCSTLGVRVKSLRLAEDWILESRASRVQVPERRCGVGVGRRLTCYRVNQDNWVFIEKRLHLLHSTFA